MSRTVIDPWCENCMRTFPCKQTVEECKKTPEVSAETIYQAMIKRAEKYHGSEESVKE